MFYGIAAMMLFVLVSLGGFVIYWEHKDRKNFAAEIDQFKVMTSVDQQAVLERARRELDGVSVRYQNIYRLWRDYKWGYRRNPYYIRYMVIRMEYASAYKRVQAFEEVVADLD